MRAFTLYWPQDPKSTEPNRPRYEGVAFSDGTVVTKALLGGREIETHPGWDEMVSGLGHPTRGAQTVFEATREGLPVELLDQTDDDDVNELQAFLVDPLYQRPATLKASAAFLRLKEGKLKG
jgi:hypothetical protein